MRKANLHSNRSQQSKKQEYHSPTRFPKKEFQFIYRQRQNLPSSEAYESIIFMKSKKCENKEPAKLAKKDKKQSNESLKKVMTKIQKQLKGEQSGQNRKLEENLKSTVLNNKTNTISFNKKQTYSKLKSKSSQRLHKYQRGALEGNENSRKHKNLLSPSRSLNQKFHEEKTMSSQFAKTTQESFGKDFVKSKNKKKNKKQNETMGNFFSFAQPQEYLLLENNFFELKSKQISILDQKYLFSKEPVQIMLNHYKPPSQLSPNHTPMIDSEAEKVFQDHLQYQSSKSSMLNNSFTDSQNHGENNLTVIQNYLAYKVKIIQRWWRGILKQQQSIKETIQECGIQSIPPSQVDNIFEADSEKSFIFHQGFVSSKDEVIKTSPIKMVDELQDNFDISTKESEIIISRENSAKLRMETHREILEKLLINKRITPEVYLDRKELIDNRYYYELQNIEELRRVLKNNAISAVEIQKKAKQDRKILQNINSQVDSSLLDKIFGIQEDNQFNPPQGLTQIPIINNSDVFHRQKSTGCHYNSEQTTNTSLYKKEIKQEEYKQDFQDEEEEDGENKEEQFDIKDTETGESVTNNFKEMYADFKLREDVKMQIDKRAAIQMGVLIEEIPAQILQELIRIDTSLTSIHRFILSFFKYYLYYYKYDFLRLINMPYGYNIDKRLKYLQGLDDEQSPEEDEDGVIYGLQCIVPEDVFEEYYEKVYNNDSQQMSSAQKANFQFQKIHHKAVFDSFNEALNIFRPYFIINGPPFPWINSEKALTFYFIAEENIQQVFEKTQFKVLKWASSLCGLIVDKYSNPNMETNGKQTAEEIIVKYQQASHPLLNETRQQRSGKEQKIEIIEKNYQWYAFDDQKAVNSIQIAQVLFGQLICQLSQELLSLDRPQEANICPELQLASVNSSFSEFQMC